MDESQAECSANDIVNNLFATCMEMTSKELDDHFRANSEMTVAQGQIRLKPGRRKNIESLVQRTRNESRLGRDHAIMSFSVDQVSDLICRYKTPAKYQVDSKTLSVAAKPDKFKDTLNWEDWKPTFLKNIRSIPGRDGVPLKYFCCEKNNTRDSNVVPHRSTNRARRCLTSLSRREAVFSSWYGRSYAHDTPHDNFFDNQVTMALLVLGDSYAIDTVQVHTSLVNFVSGKDTAEATNQGLQRQSDGRKAFKRLIEYHENVDIHAIDIHEADEVLKN